MPREGIFAILSGCLWLWEIGSISLDVSSKIGNLCQIGCGSRLSSEIFPQVGVYLAIFGGLILVIRFVLRRFDKLDYPLD